MANQKFFVQFFIFVNLYQHSKNEAVSLIYFGEMVVLEILQSDWLGELWSVYQEQDFSKTQDLCRNTANNMNFHYRTNAVKINDQIFP